MTTVAINVPFNMPVNYEIKSTHNNTNGARCYKNATPELRAQARQENNKQRVKFLVPETISVSELLVESSSKRGKFLVPETIQASQLLTETKEIDFSLAEFAVPVTTIHAKNFLGGIKLTVPPGVRVETQTEMGCCSRDSKPVIDCATGPLIIVKGARFPSDIHVKVNREVPPITIVHS